MVEFETPTYCPVCGAEAPGSGRYCSECGSDLLGETGRAPEEPPADEALGAGGAGDGPTLVTRRRLLLGGGAVLLGGGAIVALDSLGQTTHRVYGEGWDVERSSGLTSETLEGTVTIPSGRYATRILEPDVAVEYSVEFEVTDGGPIDVILLDDDEYDRYRDRNSDVQHRAQRTAAESGQLTTSVGAGEYDLVFDNTGVYGTSPDGEVTVSLTITATRA
ncbi:zinc ribbon domain-containing protein [Halorhabdus sp. BNX81]|uniref:zinc ribbon domain-containing protein n=1 Tax=Halorhabdus sp. BNX81 TaxID=2980181 RepID=UPI0023DD33E6|nr:zinc ribbon domain-containing protein [Halorhabdus sp. BNX81]